MVKGGNIVTDHRKTLAEFQKEGIKAKTKAKIWKKWVPTIEDFHLTIIIVTDKELSYQKKAWNLMRKRRPKQAFLEKVLFNSSSSSIKIGAWKLLKRKKLEEPFLKKVILDSGLNKISVEATHLLAKLNNQNR